jgi:putative peptide zinc metalloprotease protein
MTEDTKKIVLPAYLVRRFEAFRIVKNGEVSYLLRDKIQSKLHDFDAWQFFILEVLPGCETLEKLQSVFADRFDRQLGRKDVEELFGSMADRKLFDESAAQHPLLAPYMRRTYEVEDGKAKAKSFAPASAVPAATVIAAPSPERAPVPPPPPPAAAKPLDEDKDLPAGVQDALGMDWRTTKKFVGLVDPRPALRLLAPVLRPLRHVVYAVPLLLVATLLVCYQYFDLLVADVVKIEADLTLLEHLIFIFLTVHVVTTLTAATVADAYKVAVEKLGIGLVFGFMPRWVVKMNGAERLTRKQTMWLHGATLIARLVMFCVGILVWFNSRDSMGQLSDFGLMLGLACLLGLVLESGNPLVKANAYYLLSAYLNEPHLRGKAYAALLNKLRGGVYRAADNTLLALYAVLSTTYVVLLILLVGWMLTKYLFSDLGLGGSALLVTLGFVGYMLWRNYVGLKKFGDTFEKQAQFDRWRTRTLPSDAEAGEVAPASGSYWTKALLVCLLLALFIPYTYEAGGPFTVHPARKQVLSTDTPGLIEAVLFEGGETVKQGTPLARLAHADYQAEIKVLSARIDEQKAVIQNLKTLPRPEDVKVAEQKLELERSREVFSRDKVPRLEKLHKIGAVSFEDFEAARKEHAGDQQQVAQRQAELALVKAPVTTDQIAAAQAKLVSLQEERASFESKVERTVLRMPFDGNILTLRLQDKVNSYLEKGAPFAAIENTGTVTANIDIPEGDLQFVKLGAAVRARAVSYFDDHQFEGKVTVIDRNITAKSTGNVVTVIATIDNPDGVLKTGMAGRAKIVGVTMPVWKAFTLAIVRFFQIQVWSWLP